MNVPTVQLDHLDNLWFQVSGTLCNIACAHCFNNSGPNVRTFGLLPFETFSSELGRAAKGGVKEVFFTGGEPFLHPRLVEMLERSLSVAPTTVLTNGMLINDRTADRLAEIEMAARYSLEIRVSLDGFTEAMNDAIRGAGVFRQVLAATERLSARGLLPLITIVRSWREEDELATLAGFVRTLQAAGCARPRIKMLPDLPLGRELERQEALGLDPSLVTEAMLDGFDRAHLMCSNSRLVTDRGVWVCPLLLEKPDARLGDSLETAASHYALAHHACVACYQYGTICSNLNPEIEGTLPAPKEHRF